MAASRQIIDLRNLLAERFQNPPAVAGGQISIPFLERATNGGLRKGAITEIISSNASAGSALLIQLAANRTTRLLFSRPHRWSRFVRCPICRHRHAATFALGPLRESNRSDQSGRFSFARRKFPTRHPRSRFESSGRIAPHSSDELVSLATIGRTSADRVCGNEPPQHGGERAH